MIRTRKRFAASGPAILATRLGVVAALLLALAAGVATASRVTPASAADDPAPTEPAPDPAPTPDPAPAPKPAPKPKPAPAAPQPRPVSRPRPAVATPSAPTVVHTPSRPTTHRVKKHPKRHVVHKKKAVEPAPAAPLPKVLVPVRRSGATISSSDSSDLGALLFIVAVGLAIGCLGVAALPASYVPWRPVAYFVATRHLDMAILGLAFLLLAAFTLIATTRM